MKPKITFLLIFIFSNTLIFSQENHKFGLKLGANYMSPNPNYYEPNVGYQGGIYSNISIYKKIVSLQLEMLLAKSGFEVVSNGSHDKADITYFNIPLFLKINIWKPISIYAGNQVGLRTNYKYHFNESIQHDPEEDPDKVVFSPLVGLEIQPHPNLGMEIRYSVGLERSREHITNIRGFEFFVFYEF